MSRTTVRVDLPVGSPDDLLTLSKAVLTEHDRLEKDTPGSSPVPKDLVQSLRDIVAEADPQRTEAKQLSRRAQDLNEKANISLGLASGQTLRTDGTALNLVGRIRDTLQARFLGNESAMEPFGFDVVIGTAAAPQKKAAAAAKP